MPQAVVATFGARDIRLLTPEERKAKERMALIERARGLKRKVKRERGRGNEAVAASLDAQVQRLRNQIHKLGEEQ